MTTITYMDTQRKRRGHAFLPPKAVMRKIPPLRGTEHINVDQKIVHAHYFVGGSDWWVVELDPDTLEAFGYAQILEGEWGYFSLIEMEQVTARPAGFPFGLVIERDCFWTPTAFCEVNR